MSKNQTERQLQNVKNYKIKIIFFLEIILKVYNTPNKLMII